MTSIRVRYKTHVGSVPVVLTFGEYHVAFDAVVAREFWIAQDCREFSLAVLESVLVEECDGESDACAEVNGGDRGCHDSV